VIQANQYRATRYHMVWARRGTVASMSRTGNCYDNNAPVERCFSSLKNKLVRHRQFQNQAEARQAIVGSIEECSTRQRWHQALGYRSPEEVEQMAG
jgi:putative transposase